MTFEEVKDYLEAHTDDIGQLAAQGNSLCVTIILLLEIYMDDPSDMQAVGILIMAVKEYRSKYAKGTKTATTKVRYLN